VEKRIVDSEYLLVFLGEVFDNSGKDCAKLVMLWQGFGKDQQGKVKKIGRGFLS
jgi:hypothetical protein